MPRLPPVMIVTGRLLFSILCHLGCGVSGYCVDRRHCGTSRGRCQVRHAPGYTRWCHRHGARAQHNHVGAPSLRLSSEFGISNGPKLGVSASLGTWAGILGAGWLAPEPYWSVGLARDTLMRDIQL